MDFDVNKWLEILRHYPVITVMLGGLVGGSAFTQTAKVLYLAFATTKVSTARYRASCYLLATLSTFLITNRLWEQFIGEHDTGLRHIAAFIVALACPYTYRLLKAIVAWRWPELAKRMGDTTT